jgi:sugar lactone lactonase YvrE
MKISTTFLHSATFALLGMGAIGMACSDGETTTSTGSTMSGSSSSTGGDGGSGGGGAGGGGGTAAAPSYIAQFDATKGELSEGLVVDGSTAYVGFAALGKIVTVSLPDGKVADFGAIPQFPAMGSFVLGLARDGGDALYAGVTGSNPAAFKHGIYRFPATGGDATLFAEDAGLTFPNGLVFNPKGELFVTDSVAGAIFRINPDGSSVTQWVTDPLLMGDATSKCASGLGFPLGANGLVLSDDAFFVANLDKGSIVKVAINSDGSAGAVSEHASADCAALGGADGMALDEDGSLIVALNGQNAIARVGTDGKVTQLFKGGDLGAPASVAIGMVGGARSLFITNAAFGGPPQVPGLLTFPLGE